MKAKKQPVPARSCPARPRGAARPTGPFCNPPDPEDARGHRDLSKSPRAALRGAHVPRTNAAPRPDRRATPGSEAQTARGSARGEEGQFATVRMLTPKPGKFTRKSVGEIKVWGASHYLTVTHLSHTYQELSARSYPSPPFHVRVWVRQEGFSCITHRTLTIIVP